MRASPQRKKSILVLSTSKKLSTQFGMTDFYLSFYKLISVVVFSI